ncbi:MAG: hypothetical protein FWC73_11420 [Defluviitaleaceae bacterium]|nr:hypothetical protein [Defluviitaleaceae bacterium]
MSILPKIDPEFKSLIPPLSPEERQQLEQNIISPRKCHDAIVLWEGIIIDGHNRYEICVRNGIEFQIKEMKLPDREAAKVWILTNQLGRRNLSDAARIEIALLKGEFLRKKAEMNLKHGGRPQKNDEKGLPKTTKRKPDAINIQESLASEAGVSKGSLVNYLQIKDHGSPELLSQVQSGQLKIGTAHRLLPKEILRQLDFADKIYNFIAKVKPTEGFEAAYPDIHSGLVALSEQLRELIQNLEKGGKRETSA